MKNVSFILQEKPYGLFGQPKRSDLQMMVPEGSVQKASGNNEETGLFKPQHLLKKFQHPSTPDLSPIHFQWCSFLRIVMKVPNMT